MPKRKQGEVDNEGVQDFELIELLIRETGAASSTSTQQGGDFESFKARFQSYIDQVPSYLHSVAKEGFFPHFFLGSFSTLVDTEIATKLSIEKIYFSFDSSKTLKVAVIKKGEIKSPEDAADKVRLFVIAESGSTKKKFSYGELDKILGNTKVARNDVVRLARDQGKLGVRLVEITKEKDAKGKMAGISVNVESNKLDNDASTTHEFKEIKKGVWNNPESDIAKLTNPDVEKVKEPIENILKKVSKVHSEYKNSLTYAQGTREAAHHGFVAGALVNFRYRHNLRVYLEQFAGRGYADIVLVPRGRGRSLNAVPIIIELKAGTAAGTTPGSALEQAKDYAKGFQPNTMRVLTISDNVLCVGLNLDSTEGEKFSMYISPPADRKPARPTIQKLLEVTSSWNGEESTIADLKKEIKQPLERIYHTFPGTPEKGGNYFSRFMLGQLLLADKFVDIDLEKSVFLYNEYPLASSTRSGAQSTERPVTTFMLTKGNQGQDKEVFIFHIREGGKGEFSEKKIPINLPKVGKITEVCISLQEERKPDFFDIKKIDRYNSLNEYKGGKESFNGEWKNIPYPAELKEKFDAVLESQLASSQDRSQSIGKYKELFGKLGEAVLPFKVLIEREAHTQAVFHGAFSHYSDIKLGESQENRALVLTEFQTGRGKRIDMVVHGIKFADQASSAKEYDPVGLELKGPREGKTTGKLVEEANDQINKEYVKGVTYKTLTDGDKVACIGVVFDKGASNADSLILPSKNEFTPVKVVHSSIFSFSQCATRKKRDIGISCIDSRNEEKITEKEKEQRIKELFNADKVVEKVKNIEFYDQLFKVSQQISKGEVVSQNIEEAFIAKIKDIDLNSIDPEIRDIIKVMKENIEDKEKIKSIIEKPSVAEKVENVVSRVGKFQNLVNRLSNNKKIVSHLNRAGKISDIVTQGVIIKDTLADFIRGDYKDVAVNLGFISGGHVSGKLSGATLVKGEELILSGKTILGNSLKMASPFLARGTSAFIAYDLVQQIKELKAGNPDALVGVVGDSSFIVIDLAESGVELAELSELIEGVSSFTGPIGEAAGGIIILGTQIYHAVRQVEKIDEHIHLTGWEKFKEGSRAFLDMEPERYIKKLLELKQLYNQLVEQNFQFLRNNSQISRYVFPTMQFDKDHKVQVDADSKVFLDKRRNDIKWSRARPDSPSKGSLFCIPRGEYEQVPSRGAYACENAIGIEDSVNKPSNHTLIALGKGDDVAQGFMDSPNVFLVEDGDKNFTGGIKDDTFILQGSNISGYINGGDGRDTIDLDKFMSEVHIKVNLGRNGYISHVSNVDKTLIDMDNINKVFAREGEREVINCTCGTKYVDGRGGRNSNDVDIIKIFMEKDCSDGMQVVVRPSTTIDNEALMGNFSYVVPTSHGEAYVNLLKNNSPAVHAFLFNYTIYDLKSIEIQNVIKERYITFDTPINFSISSNDTSEVFNTSISDIREKTLYRLSDGSEVKASTVWRMGTTSRNRGTFDLVGSDIILDEKFVNITNEETFYQLRNGNKVKRDPLNSEHIAHPITFSLLNNNVHDKFNVTISGVHNQTSYQLSDGTEIKIGKSDNLYAIQSSNASLDTIINNYPEMANRLGVSFFIHLPASNEIVTIGHGKQEALHNDPLYKTHLVGNGGHNVYVIAPNIDVKSCIPEVTLHHFNTEGFLDTLDLRQVMKQIKNDFSEEGSLKISESGNDLLLTVQSSIGNFSTVRLRNALENLWYRMFHVVLNNAQLQIMLSDDNTWILKPLPLVFDENKKIIVITPKDIEKEGELIVHKKVGQYIFAYLENILAMTNVFDRNSEEKDNYVILFDGFHREPKMQTLSIKFDDKEILLWNEVDKINNADALKEGFVKMIEEGSDFNLSKYYLPSQEGLQIYHNQPNNEGKIGLMDLRDKSILDCNIKIDNDALILEYKNNTFVEIENWNTYQQAREVMFAFNDTTVFNLKCIVFTCNSEDVIAEFNKEKVTLLKEQAFNAIIQDNINGAKDLTRKIESIDTESKHELTLLYMAIQEGRLDIVKLLFDRKYFSVQDQDTHGCSPLHWAAQEGELSIAGFFLDKDANTEAQDNNGWTPILFAARSGKWSVVKLLLDYYAEINNETTYVGTPLHFAIQEGSLDMVQFLLDKGASTESQDYYNRRPLHVAVEAGKLNVIRLLLDKGASTESRDNDGETSLHLAIKKGKLSVVTLLLDRGANIEARGDDDKTPLHFAAQGGNVDIVKLLLDRGIQVNIEDVFSRTPLHFAAQGSNVDIVKLLLDRGANIEHKTKFTGTPLHFAAREGNLDIVQLLLDEGANIEARSNFLNKTSLHIAAENNKSEVVKLLLDGDANIEAKDENDNTALLLAVNADGLDVIKLLLDKNANIEVKDEFGRTPIILAAQGSRWNVVKLLANKGANINGETTEYKGTPLHFAAGEGNVDIAKFLLERGAYIYSQDNRNRQPLHYAVKTGKLDIVKLLLDGGANPNVKDMDDQTPLNLATQKGYLDIVEILKPAQQGLDKELLTAVRGSNLNRVKDLISRGASLEAKDKKGSTPLHLASWNGNFEVVKYLIKEGANLEVKNYSLRTPLYDASGSGNLDVVKYLVEQGADINAKDIFGKKSIHFAAEKNHKNIIEFFLSKGVSVNDADISGWTPVFLASRDGHLDVVKYLVGKGANINTQDNRGRTPLDIAIDLKRAEIVKYLKEELNQKRGSPAQRKRRHLAIDLSNQPEVVASSGTRPSSWIKGLLDWIKEKGGGLISSVADKFAAEESENSKLGDTGPCSAGLEKMYSATIPQSRKSLSTPKGNIPNRSCSSNREKVRSNVTVVPEINTAVVDNALILGDLAVRLVNGRRHKQPIHENLLSPRERSMRFIDEDMIIRAIQQGKEKFGVPGTNMDEVEIIGNKNEIGK
ncbi:ankyrin repeat domain-containing protein [Wolbachia endosymbiont (group A) of Philonthus cognatus]|uniref:ankyrin repeat domain-containing protein n=1 Tax=Wolbachia endosymbiont (group A) of Philonthus cognatus TaxID=2954046 RepID=UPI00222E3553|nr:ankyrin repeat domain-containing protein [Wolbachia endosymbiont (group A) of Philonthus cognatus]